MTADRRADIRARLDAWEALAAALWPGDADAAETVVAETVFAVVVDLLAAERERADQAEADLIEARAKCAGLSDLAAENRERADRAEREAADLLAALEEKATCACGHGVVCQECALVDRERADREKARADALEDVIAKVRALADQLEQREREEESRDHDGSLLALIPAGRAARIIRRALLPDDTKEADRG